MKGNQGRTGRPDGWMMEGLLRKIFGIFGDMVWDRDGWRGKIRVVNPSPVWNEEK